MAVVCKRVLYSGRVQGVGFRFTAQLLASSYPVSGQVRNLPSGDVELVAEGEDDQLEAYLNAVSARMRGYIRQARVTDEPPAGRTGFHVAT